jgi:hypothetical protein
MAPVPGGIPETLHGDQAAEISVQTRRAATARRSRRIWRRMKGLGPVDTLDDGLRHCGVGKAVALCQARYQQGHTAGKMISFTSGR